MQLILQLFKMKQKIVKFIVKVRSAIVPIFQTHIKLQFDFV